MTEREYRKEQLKKTMQDIRKITNYIPRGSGKHGLWYQNLYRVVELLRRKIREG